MSNQLRLKSTWRILEGIALPLFGASFFQLVIKDKPENLTDSAILFYSILLVLMVIVISLISFLQIIRRKAVGSEEIRKKYFEADNDDNAFKNITKK